jgi:hypothetical protein
MMLLSSNNKNHEQGGLQKQYKRTQTAPVL